MKRALIVLALIAALILGGLYEHAFMTRSRLQLAADSVAQAAAIAALEGRDVRTAKDRLDLFPQLRLAAVELQAPPERGRYRGWKNTARVRIHAYWKPPLFPDAFARPMVVSATAIAVRLPNAAAPVPIRVE